VEPKYLRYILQIQTLYKYIDQRGVLQKIDKQEYKNSDDLLAEHQSDHFCTVKKVDRKLRQPDWM